MAPSPEYDKEPKAPDKSATHISSEDTKLLHNLVNDQHNSSDHKTNNSAANSEVENKHVETLDDEKLRALLDEAITYKCPKDREGKSSLFKELLEEVEQDEQACEAAARNLTGCRGSRRGARGRRALPHSNSLQDLVAALAAEPVPRHPRHHPRHHAPAPSNVSARAIHGGSLPSGVDTSSLLSEDGGSSGGAGYLATVRCVNPPPLAERRVSASDANAPQELDLLNRRRSPMFPVTYTARATLEIGSGSVCSGRAVTTTTASNQQVRTPPDRRARSHPPHPSQGKRPRGPHPTHPPHDHHHDHAWDPDQEMARSVDMWYRGLANYDAIEPDRSRSAPMIRHDAPHIREPQHIPYGADPQSSDKHEGDISLRKKYRKEIGNRLVKPTMSMLNPRNVRSMTSGKPLPYYKRLDSNAVKGERTCDSAAAASVAEPAQAELDENVSNNNEICIEVESVESAMSVEDQTSKCFQMSDSGAPGGARPIELEEIVCHRAKDNTTASSFTEFLGGQQRLLRAIHDTDRPRPRPHDEYNITENNNNITRYADKQIERDVSSDKEVTEIETIDLDATDETDSLMAADGRAQDRPGDDRYILAELPNNAYIFLTLPKRLLNKDDELHDIDATNVKPIEYKKRKKDKVPVGTSSSKRTETINKNALRVLLFENLFKSDREMSHGSADNEVDSAIPFSCITTPEVVASCNTTSSSSTAVAIDSKPLQLGSGYRAVASLASSPPSTSSSPPARPATDAPELQPRNAIGSGFNSLPLSRPNYGSTATTTNDEYKKSLDENGNAVQGSPLASSHNKKPRRKKSSKNETVIDCKQIDGYRGDKADLNELLRFIESNPDTRGPKMRAKHKDDADDKAKKRCSDRRKDKEKVKRASSLEELSRTKLEDLTARPAPAPKPERRSWGDATPSVPSAPLAPQPAPEPAPTPTPPEPKETPTPPAEPEAEMDEPIELLTHLELPLPLPEPVVEQADFQTVTKKRKPRRRTEEAPRRTRQPSPRRQESAPPSDRSNDSNDDMDSVHSLPQPGAVPLPAIPHASYADIARTRNNIPDLIESCNYYTEGEENRSVPAADSDYPALETRIPEPPPPALPPRRREPKAGPPPRRDRKDRTVIVAPSPAPDCPAPDVVADRRPPVILLDSSSRPRDMDGVTFGFDINEQLLGGPRRGRCDLVRDAVEPPMRGVAVGTACRPLRYLPPEPPPHSPHLHQIIDYVGAAWEDVLRCDSGKVRYFTE